MSRALAVAAFLVAWGLGGPAQAESNPEAEAAAAAAAEVFDTHCSATALDDNTAAAGAVAAVSQTWELVSAALDSTDAIYLRYWRGVLAQCLSQEDRALGDLRQFVVEADGSTLWATLIAQAKKRILRLERAQAGGPANPGLGVGVLGAVFAVGSGACAGLAGWQWEVALATGAELEGSVHEREVVVALGLQGDQAAALSTGLAIGSGALGAASLVSFVLSAAEKARWTASRRLSTPVFAAVPTPDGLAVVVGGRF